ncbi:EF-hand domain-containing protein [Streptomyces celluloflavus]|uniref:EF-hand domain-containing protein n=1 Tax=Streptomyces celluloflavus TaxID=58344 RepID=UPI00369CB715
MISTEFQNLKLTQRFQMFDLDGDGFVSRSDFESVARRIAEALGVPIDNPKAQAVRDAYLAIWNVVATKMNIDPITRIDVEKFKVATQSVILAQGELGYKQTLGPAIDAIAQLTDTDGDGKISEEEYTKLIQAIGGRKEDAANTYGRLDSNRDGVVSIDELAQTLREFFYAGDTNAVGSELYGSVESSLKGS